MEFPGHISTEIDIMANLYGRSNWSLQHPIYRATFWQGVERLGCNMIRECNAAFRDAYGLNALGGILNAV
jgi:hypothetical protein